MIFDSDIMVDTLRKYPPALSWLNSITNEVYILPGFVVMELINGCKNKAEQIKVEREVEKYEIIWPTPKVCNEALLTFSKHHFSHGIGILDSLIGQLAVDMKLPLYTFNQKHYAAIQNLKTIQPYKK